MVLSVIREKLPNTDKKCQYSAIFGGFLTFCIFLCLAAFLGLSSSSIWEDPCLRSPRRGGSTHNIYRNKQICNNLEKLHAFDKHFSPFLCDLLDKSVYFCDFPEKNHTAWLISASLAFHHDGLEAFLHSHDLLFRRGGTSRDPDH